MQKFREHFGNYDSTYGYIWIKRTLVAAIFVIMSFSMQHSQNCSLLSQFQILSICLDFSVYDVLSVMSLCSTDFQGWIFHSSTCGFESWSSHRSSGADCESSLWLWFPVHCEWCTCMFSVHFCFFFGICIVYMLQNVTTEEYKLAMLIRR